MRGDGFLAPEAPQQPASRGIALRSWKPLRKGSLVGFAEIELPLIVIPDPVHLSQGKRWAGTPGGPVIDPEGRHKLVEGKRAYVPAFTWRSREIANRFSRAVVELVEQHYPEAFAAHSEGAP
jgi:hypothetical protein